MKKLKTILSQFNPVSLDETGEVKLMDRIDKKYWFHISTLEVFLQKISPYYDILEINENRLFKYQSTYFDTADNFMYLKHHNRKLNRYKVRRRSYVTTGDDFFETKLKTNKKRTIKQRIKTESGSKDLLPAEIIFVAEQTPFNGNNLVTTLNNWFYRITLIHKEKLDRCTIDIQIKFWNNNGEICFDDLVVFELKRGRSFKKSPVVNVLRQLKIRQRGLSKYCTGCAILEPKLKRNSFKSRIQFLDKNILN